MAVNIDDAPWDYPNRSRAVVDSDLVASLWPFCDAPDTDATRAEVWKRLAASPLVLKDAEIAAIVSGA